jgi:type III secretion protein J
MCRLRIPVALVFTLLSTIGCKEVLYSRLSEQQANEVLAALNESQIPASKSKVEDNIWQVSVEDDRIGEAASVLRSQGLPREKHVSMGELFKQDGMIPSQTAERIRFVFSLSEELGVTVKKIPGVLDARVHVVIPKNDPLSNHVAPSSASVFIKHYADTNIGLLSPSIKDLVVASVEGLEHKNVALFTFALPTPSPSTREPKSQAVVALQAAPIGSLALIGSSIAVFTGLALRRRSTRRKLAIACSNGDGSESGAGAGDRTSGQTGSSVSRKSA